MRQTDLTYLKDLSSGNNEFVREMVTIFLEETPAALKQLQKHLKNGDLKQLSAVAHKMKPSVYFMGIKKLEATMARLENSANTEIPHADLTEMVEEVIKIANEGMLELNNLVKMAS